MPTRILAWLGTDDTIEVSADDFDVVLINSGTRAVSVLSLSIVFVQLEDDTSEECSYDSDFLTKENPYHAAIFQTNFRSEVIKEKEILAATVQISKPAEIPLWGDITKKIEKNKYSYPLEHTNLGLAAIRIGTCVRTVLVTPSTPVSETREVLMVRSWSDNGGVQNPTVVPGERVLVKNTTTIFQR